MQSLLCGLSLGQLTCGSSCFHVGSLRCSRSFVHLCGCLSGLPESGWGEHVILCRFLCPRSLDLCFSFSSLLVENILKIFSVLFKWFDTYIYNVPSPIFPPSAIIALSRWTFIKKNVLQENGGVFYFLTKKIKFIGMYMCLLIWMHTTHMQCLPEPEGDDGFP